MIILYYYKCSVFMIFIQIDGDSFSLNNIIILDHGSGASLLGVKLYLRQNFILSNAELKLNVFSSDVG